MQKKKGLALVLSFALVACLAVAGTLAWLTSTTGEVKNTFTVGKVEIVLDESPVDYANGAWTLNTEAADILNNDYTNVYPGAVLPKDPAVTVKKDSEACWLFVEVKPDTDPAGLLSYSVRSGDWAPLAGVEGVYYKEIATATTADTDHLILTNNQVVVSENAAAGAEFTEITFKAYAIQRAGFDDPVKAWEEVSKQA